MIRPLSCVPVLVAGLAAPAFAETTQRDLDAWASEMFAATYGEACMMGPDDHLSDRREMERHDFGYTPEFGTPQTVTVYRFFCYQGAYNIQHAFLIHKDFYGMQPLTFAAPRFETIFEDDDEEKALLDVMVTGMTTYAILTNSEIDPETGDIVNHSYWRGLGDASSSGRWVLEGDEYHLVSFDVDPTYDGEINPVRLLDYRAQSQP